MGDTIGEIQARQAITHGIYAYCRAIDRMDRQLLSTVFHPTAIAHYPNFTGTPSELADWLWTGHRARDMHSHQVTNIIVEFDDNLASAVSEAYVTAVLWRGDKGTELEQMIVPGHQMTATTWAGTRWDNACRYLDRWSVMDGLWAIDERRVVADIMTITRTRGLVGAARRDLQDPSYELLPGRDRISP
jgi:hypothetical protein